MTEENRKKFRERFKNVVRVRTVFHDEDMQREVECFEELEAWIEAYKDECVKEAVEKILSDIYKESYRSDNPNAVLEKLSEYRNKYTNLNKL